MNPVSVNINFIVYYVHVSASESIDCEHRKIINRHLQLKTVLRHFTLYEMYIFILKLVIVFYTQCICMHTHTHTYTHIHTHSSHSPTTSKLNILVSYPYLLLMLHVKLVVPVISNQRTCRVPLFIKISNWPPDWTDIAPSFHCTEGSGLLKNGQSK